MWAWHGGDTEYYIDVGQGGHQMPRPEAVRLSRKGKCTINAQLDFQHSPLQYRWPQVKVIMI